ncbi:hypothetical protein CBR61_01440 [Porphyrobacter sp. CACIAM 03H1]|nr:hypothetical protein CBR61_01440 [Porphyrobacter sp. CACIAM 03H1]
MKLCSHIGNAFRMSEDPRKNMSREERLAAKLRENLRRRKAQARAMGDSDVTESLPIRSDES